MKKSALIILGLLAISVAGKAQDEKFKALFMYNFTKYIEWPQNKQSGDFVIGVVGGSPIVDELNAIAQRKTVGSQTIWRCPAETWAMPFFLTKQTVLFDDMRL